MTASVFGHIQNFHVPYLQEFQRLGWETHVGCRGIPQDVPYIDQAIEIPFEKKLVSPANFYAAWLLRERIRAEHYELIITHTSLAAFFTRLAAKGLPARPRLVNVMHGYLFDDETPLLKRELLLEAERLTAPETDLLLTMNVWDFQMAKKHRLGKQIEIIPGMGVDFTRLEKQTKEDGRFLRKKLHIPEESFVLIYPAEFSNRKSQHILIKAMTMLPEESFLILPGSGDRLEHCKKMTQALRLCHRVVFPGQISEMREWYQTADAAVTASRSEGLPFNVMEAMHMGLPVIASAVKGHIDLIRDGATGLLYDYGNAEQCAACILRLMKDAKLREALGKMGKTMAEKYAIQTVLPLNMEKYLRAMGDALCRK